MKITFVLDSSGSMDAILDDTIGGFNAFVKSRSPPETMSLYTFSDTCTLVYRDVPVEHVKPLDTKTFLPGGCTALYDALGKVIKEEPSKSDTILVILTDGQENSSKTYTKSHVKDLLESAGFIDVIYVGVTLEDAVDLGIRTTLQYDSQETPMQTLFKNVSESVSLSAEKQRRLRTI